MIGDTVHGKDEFSDIDWDYVNTMDIQGYVTFAMGGNGLPDGTWTVNIGNDKGVYSDVYVLPDYLQYMINTINQWGKDESRRKIRNKMISLFSELGLSVNYSRQ